MTVLSFQRSHVMLPEYQELLYKCPFHLFFKLRFVWFNHLNRCMHMCVGLGLEGAGT